MEKDTLGRLLSIGGVAREIGLSEDTLRMWERRYGFPTPLRETPVVGTGAIPRNRLNAYAE